MTPDGSPEAGVTGMDHEHQVQMGLLLGLEQGLALGKSREQLLSILYQLVDYTNVHFMSEQMLMRLYAYPEIAAHEAALLDYASRRALAVPGLRLVGEAPGKAAILSFVLEGIHPHDIGTILDMEGVAIRTGHHCAMPVMDFYQVPATARASFAMYNTKTEIDVLMNGITSLIEVFG